MPKSYWKIGEKNNFQLNKRAKLFFFILHEFDDFYEYV